MSKDSCPPRTQLKRGVRNDDELGDSAAVLVGILESGITCAAYVLAMLIRTGQTSKNITYKNKLSRAWHVKTPPSSHSSASLEGRFAEVPLQEQQKHGTRHLRSIPE